MVRRYQKGPDLPGRYLNPTDASAVSLFQRQIHGPVIMLNLLRLRDVADYSDFPDLDPGKPISGAEAIDRYIELTLPYLKASDSTVRLLATGGPWFIGPPEERWDVAMLIEQSSVDAFISFASDPDYLAILGHRNAAAEDSRLLPLQSIPSVG